MSLFNKVIIILILGLRPLFGTAHCKYVVTCTQFARWQLEEKQLLPAMWTIIKRVISCNPWWIYEREKENSQKSIK